jgi:hypothetical protein
MNHEPKTMKEAFLAAVQLGDGREAGGFSRRRTLRNVAVTEAVQAGVRLGLPESLVSTDDETSRFNQVGAGLSNELETILTCFEGHFGSFATLDNGDGEPGVAKDCRLNFLLCRNELASNGLGDGMAGVEHN